MSYVLHVWEHDPLPTTIHEADELHTRLSAQRGKQNPKFIQLAERLSERYPCDADDDDGDACVWSDGRLDGRTEEAVYSIGVQTTAVIPFLVECANKLGLTVYDDQAGEAHLPSGAVLTLPGQAPSAMDQLYVPDPDSLETKADVAQALKAGLRDLMEENGFKATGFSRFERPGTELLFDISETGSGYDVGMGVSIYPPFTEEIDRLLPKLFLTNWCYLDLKQFTKAASEERKFLSINEYEPPSFHIRRRAGDLAAAVEKMKLFLKVDLLPFIDACKTFQQMDYYMNNPNRELRRLHQQSISMVIAYLAGNPRVEEIAAELIESKDHRRRYSTPERNAKVLAFLATLKTHGGKST